MKQTTIEQELREKGQGLFQTKGVSMEPLLHHHYSTVLIQTFEGAPRLNDVLLYKRPDGTYVLHRVIKVARDSCITLGDNSPAKENVPFTAILGRMTGFFNGDDFTDCETDESYKRYLKKLPFLRIKVFLRSLRNRFVR